MHSRAALAGSSSRAKQHLVKILFGPKYSKKGRDAHRKLDHSIYSYKDLKAAYLERAQELHPDKHRSSDVDYQDISRQFVQLKEAWHEYEAFARMMKTTNGDNTEASFTMFGVGCSFSDNDEERERRAEITDQACRGWFSSGELGIGEDGHDARAAERARRTNKPLLDESLFEQFSSNAEKSDSQIKTRSLIGHLLPPNKR